jgi:hypothetical protein
MQNSMGAFQFWGVAHEGGFGNGGSDFNRRTSGLPPV